MNLKVSAVWTRGLEGRVSAGKQSTNQGSVHLTLVISIPMKESSLMKATYNFSHDVLKGLQGVDALSLDEYLFLFSVRTQAISVCAHYPEC